MSQRSNPDISKNGRSRFSKALPSVPGLSSLDDSASLKHSLSSPSLSSPSLKDLPLPPLPPPHPPSVAKSLPSTPRPNRSDEKENNITIARKPVESNLPPHSPLTALQTPSPSASALSSGRPKMSIPRRPVANNNNKNNLQPPLSPERLQQPSPVDSLSDFLSAYTRDSDEWEAKTWYETTPASVRTSEEGASLNGEKSSLIAAKTQNGSGSRSTSQPGAGIAAAGAPQSQRRFVDENQNETLPPPSPKDDYSQTQTPAPSAATELEKELPAGPSDLATPSSPRPEIWRRRPHMSQSSRELLGLKLDSSNGSTAETAQPAADLQPSQPSLSETPTPATKRAPPFAGGLPGRNIRRPTVKGQLPATQTMGNEASKLKQIKEKLGSSQRSGPDSSPPSTKSALPGRPAAQRPPTPEYQKEDIKEAVLDLFISPVSPAASPEAPRGVSPDFSKQLPPKPPRDESQDETQNPVSRKALPTIPDPRSNNAKSLPQPQPQLQPQLRANTASPTNESPLSMMSSAVPTRDPSPPNDVASNLSRYSEERATLESQSATPRPDVQRQRIVESPRFPQMTSDPRLVQSETQGLLYRGRDGTLYPEMKVDREPDPKATYFPVQQHQGLPKDGIVKARPLADSHFNCFQRHRMMNRRSNRNCPLTCQTCDRADLDDRWVCGFCNLRICDSCFRMLGGYQRDLRRLVDNLANNAPLSLSSQSRPGTALGLQSMP